MNCTGAGSSIGAEAGVTGAYTGTSFVLRAAIISFVAVACYNAIELVFLIFATFKKYRGLYFWSLLVASCGVVPHSLGFLFKYFQIISDDFISVAIVILGWYCMVTGQSFVLYSRLHLVLRKERTLRAVFWMIVIDAVIFHVPTTVLVFGSNGTISQPTFVSGYNIMEKIQMTGFCIQEFIISGIYLWETRNILKTSKHEQTRKTLYQLFCINLIIIPMDLGLLGLEYANLYILETSIKGLLYSIKLKLEFAILGKLVQFVSKVAAVDTSSVSEFLDVSQPLPGRPHPSCICQGRSLSMPARLDYDDTVGRKSESGEMRSQDSHSAKRNTEKAEHQHVEQVRNDDDLENMMRRYSVI
jgi:hypothetical protein